MEEGCSGERENIKIRNISVFLERLKFREKRGFRTNQRSDKFVVLSHYSIGQFHPWQALGGEEN